MKDKWVIVFLIYADFRKNATDGRIDPLAMTEQMKAELNSLFKDILMVPLNARRARMYVIINSIDYKEGDGSKTEAKTLFYEIGNPNDLDYNEIVYCEVISNRQGNSDRPNPDSPIQNPDFLKRVLSRIPVYENEQVFFCTHDHGSAFGIFREIDPGLATAEFRKPINIDLRKYPYLAAFWYRALEEDNELERLMNRSYDHTLPKLLQIGHTLFRVKPIVDVVGFYERSILSNQTSLQVRFHDSSLDAQNLLLVFANGPNAFEIWDSAFYKENMHLTNDIAAVLETDDVREILSNDELATVFTSWLDEKKVAVLLMMNCWMMNLHTMYSFRDTVKCLIAPQGDIGVPGYNYKAILSYLFSRKSFFKTPVELAIKCVTTSENKRMRKMSKKLRNDKKDTIDKYKIFAVDLQRKKDNKLVLEDHFEKLNNIILQLKPKNQDAIEAIQLYKFIRIVSHDFSKNGFIDEDACLMVDIIGWLHTLNSLRKGNGRHQPFPIDDDIIKLAGQLVEQIYDKSETSQIVLAESKGKEVYGANLAVIKVPPTGYSLFFPNFPNNNENLIDNVRKDSLLKNPDFHWKEFLKAVYPPKVWGPFFDS